MQIANIKGERREPGGRHANERLRRRGLVPAIVYGHGEKPETVALSARDLEQALEDLAHVVSVETGGKPQQYLIKDVQFDHLQKRPLHVDLMRVDATERVKVKVPLELRGDAKGASQGGVLVQLIGDLDVECLLLAIPDSIRVNVSELGLNQSLHVRELEMPEGVKALHHPEEIVVVCRPPRAEVPVAAAPVEGAEGPAEPEVIGRVAKEKEGEGEGAEE